MNATAISNTVRPAMHADVKDDHAIEVRDLWMTFPGKRKGEQIHVLENVNLSVKRGEFVCIVGPSGCGKSTLLNIIGGFLQQTTGSVLVEGKPVTGPDPKRIFVFQENGVFPWLTVEDNVMAILETRDNLDETARHERLEQILGELRIGHVRKSLGMALSGGERRRVEIARALAAEPRFVLLDEPFAGVDPLSVIDIQRIMTELTAKGIGVLITDHNVRETLGVCGRAYIVSGGTVIASGTSEEILANPQVREVYLGQSFRM